jgi:hypothetical protein
LAKGVQPLKEDDFVVYREPGTAIRGDKILAEARKFTPKGMVTGSSKHRKQRYDLDVNAFCVIEREFVLMRK